MHNNIMAAGSRDRPPMLAPGRYPQWHSRFLQYVDTRQNGEALRKCILSGPYKPSTVLAHDVEATDNSPVVAEHTTLETPANMSLKNKAHFLAEKEAIHLIQTGIGDDIYSTLEWSRFVTIFKQQHKLDEVSYHKLFNILKKYQNKVNELRAEKLARNANPLALVATAQASQYPYYQTPRSHRSSAPLPKPSISSRSHTSTRHKGKEIAKPITPPSETTSEEDSNPKQAQRDKDMQKNLALIAKYFKKIYKPTNNNLRTSSNSKNKNVDTTPRYKNNSQSGEFGTQRTVNVDAARENVRSKVVQQSGIQCFNCKEYGHFAKECIKPKNVKDSAYHKEKMLLCKQAEQGVPLYMAKIQEVPTANLNTDSKPVEQVQTDAGYNVFANDLQHSEQSKSVSNTCLVETDDSNVTPDSLDMCEDDIQNDQNDVESDDERVMLANLNVNLKHDVDENKKIQKQLKKANTILAQELTECKAVLPETSQSLGESISVRDSCLVALQTKQTEFEKYKAFNDRTIDYEKLELKLKEALGQIAHKDTDLFRTPTALDIELLIQTCLMPLAIKTESDSLKFVHELKQEMHTDLKYVESLEKEIDELESEKVKECDCLAQRLSKQTDSVSKKTRSIPKANVSEGLSKAVTAQTLPHTMKKVVSNTNVLKPGMYRINNRTTHTRALQLPQTVRNTYPRVSTSTGVSHNTNVSRLQLKSNQSKDKVLPNNSQVKAKKTRVEVHHRIPSVSNKKKSIITCKDSLNYRTLIVNAVCATCNKCLVDSNHFTCVTKMLNDVHARTKKPNVVPISTRKPKSQANKSIATPNKKKVASKSTNKKPQSYFRVMYENTNKEWKWVYYVEGINHNLFSVGQFCDADLELAFRMSTCFVRDLQEHLSDTYVFTMKMEILLEPSSYKLLVALRFLVNPSADCALGRIVGNKMHKAFPLPGESSHWQYKFPLPVEGVPTARRMEIPLPGVCTAMMKKLPVKEKWQLH
nr:integrase, catalytic region, zinc finger, CCHC-type, peptidase aspartic, catalytic [Tanacetum cinerariifolium]